MSESIIDRADDYRKELHHRVEVYEYVLGPLGHQKEKIGEGQVLHYNDNGSLLVSMDNGECKKVTHAMVKFVKKP